MHYHDHNLTPRTMLRQRPHAHSRAKMRMWIAQTNWLDGRLCWHNGRSAWDDGHQIVAPTDADLARAEYYLDRIVRHPLAFRWIVDYAAWLRRRRARLALAARIAVLRADDLRDAANADRRRLALLLTLEALCHDELPCSPAAALLARRDAAPLVAVLNDITAPVAGQALAALVLGAIEQRENREIAEPQNQRNVLAASPAVPQFCGCVWTRRAYVWGREFGFPSVPVLVLSLLCADDGLELARRYVAARAASPHMHVPDELLRELLGRGVAPTQIVALAEAAAQAEQLAVRVQREPLPINDRMRWNLRYERTQQHRSKRQRAIAALRDTLHNAARTTGDPAALAARIRLATTLLDVGPASPELVEAVCGVLRAGQELPPALYRDFVTLLVERHERVWNRASLKERHTPEALAKWTCDHWEAHGLPLLTLTHRSGNAAIARAACDLNVHSVLADYQWHDSERYRWALTLTRTHQLNCNGYGIHHLCRLLDSFGDIRAARAALQPLTDALLAASEGRRKALTNAAIDAVLDSDRSHAEAAQRLTRYMPLFIVHIRQDEALDDCHALMVGLIALDACEPEATWVWLDWLLSYLRELHARGSSDTIYHNNIVLAMRLGGALADGYVARFRPIAEAILSRRLTMDHTATLRGIAALARFPAVAVPLRTLFAQQPQRCINVLERLGRIAALGGEMVHPFAELAPLDGANALLASSDPGWRDLLDHAPDLAAPAAAYIYARWLLGEATDVPGGVRRALDLPRKLAGELAHLERTLAQQPARADFAARAASLRARLSDDGRLRAVVLAEAREKLAQRSAETQLAAVEQQIVACYRLRLRQVAGPLPAVLHFDDDLLNATLLSADITENRSLLRHMLRAHLNGDTDWREQQPANATFLHDLAKRGVDVATWLDAVPRTYDCESVGRVRLHLERNPLRILQMGNVVGTCLSLGQMNAFAVVANACDLNKRVIYAADHTGRVVARKLIAVSAEWTLVGFHTYCVHGDEQVVAALRNIVQRYAGDFAARCGLALADDGNVPYLVAPQWYNDGTEAWDEQEQRQTDELANRQISQ